MAVVAIEPYKRTVLISDVRAVWHRLGKAFPRNPAMVRRLMTLYLGDGVSYMMSTEGVYMACDFNRLSQKGLGYKHPVELLDAVEKSGAFIIAKSNDSYGLSWFASPLYLNEKELEEAMNKHKNSANTDAQDASQTDAASEDDTSSSGDSSDSESLQPLDPRIGVYNRIINYSGIYNIILSGRKAELPPSGGEGTNRPPNGASSTDGGSTGAKAGSGYSASSNSLPPYEVRQAEVECFIREIYADKEFFYPLREMLTAKELNGEPRPANEVFTIEQAREILNRLMYYHVKPYFMQQLRFFKYPAIDGRREWLRNWIYGEKGRKLIRAATNYCRRKWKREEQQAFVNKCRAMTDNHPLSPYEWTDPATDRRYYRESPSEIVALPDDAPPRPSDTAHWNKFTKTWK